MQPFIKIISRCSEGETVEVRMKDGLPENAMLPEHGRSIKAREKLAHFVFQGEEFRI